MRRVLSGRKIAGGRAEGEVLRSAAPISFFGGVDPDSGVVCEPGHPLEGLAVAARVLVFPSGKGSTVGSYSLYRLARAGRAPAAIVNTECETIIAVGAIIGSIPCVDHIALDELADGARVEVDGDSGLVTLLDAGPAREPGDEAAAEAASPAGRASSAFAARGDGAKQEGTEEQMAGRAAGAPERARATQEPGTRQEASQSAGPSTPMSSAAAATELIVLKIGGGAVTHKNENERRARPEVIRRIAQEIRRAKAERGLPLLAIHGAGPFGHRLVAEYGISGGLASPAHIEGFVRTHNSMEDLNKLFMDIFREEGLLVFPVQPSACLLQRGGAIAEVFFEPIERLLALEGVIPLLYGDMVADRTLGASVVSGDALVVELGRRLSAHRVLLGTDVAGVFTADPKLDSSARPLPRIDRESLPEVLRDVGGASTVDVTGGMRGKVEEIARGLEGREVLVFDITKKENLYRALTGQPIPGTVIVL